MSSAQRVPAHAPHVEVASLDAEAVLYDVRAARPVLLNTTAAAVWGAIDGVRTVSEIAADLAVQFGAEPDQVETDVAATIVSFDRLDLLIGTA